MRAHLSRLALLASLTTTLGASGCGPDDPITETVVVIHAERGVKSETTHVRVVITGARAGSTTFGSPETRVVPVGEGEKRFPLFLTLTPRGGDADGRFRVEATAIRDGEDGPAVAIARVESGFVADQTLVAELTFEDACRTVSCDETSTCEDGTCVPSAVSPDGLVVSDGPVDRCLYGNGGCDPAMPCSARGARVRCGACPTGFVDDGPFDCRLTDPRLLGLASSNGRLAATFDPDAAEVTIRLPIDAETTALIPTARDVDGAAITIGGVAVTSGEASAPIATGLGTTDATIAITTETGASRSYVVHLVRAIEHDAYVKAPVIEEGARFGSVAMDGSVVAVGSPREDVRDGTTLRVDAGAVHVYTRLPDGRVVFDATLRASNPGDGDEFGTDVVISGDTIAVSAPLEDSGATTVNGERADESRQDSGAVYVFERQGGTWVEVAYLKVPANRPTQSLGFYLALDGNVLVATRPTDDGPTNATIASGAAEVFERTGNGWIHKTTLRAPVQHANDRFGGAVDVDATTIVVGATHEDGTSTNVGGDPNVVDANANFDAGAVFVYARSTSGTWTLQAYAKASHPGTGDTFGTAVALTGDTLAVGVPGDDSNSTAASPNPAIDGLTDSGGVFLFSRSGSTWSPSGFLKAHVPGDGDRFGNNLVIDGNVLVAASPYEDGGGRGVNPVVDETVADAGAVYVFVRTSTTFGFHAYLKAEAPDPGDFFTGLWVDRGRILVGARFEDGGNTSPEDDSSLDSGAAYVYE